MYTIEVSYTSMITERGASCTTQSNSLSEFQSLPVEPATQKIASHEQQHNNKFKQEVEGKVNARGQQGEDTTCNMVFLISCTAEWLLQKMGFTCSSK